MGLFNSVQGTSPDTGLYGRQCDLLREAPGVYNNAHWKTLGWVVYIDIQHGI